MWNAIGIGNILKALKKDVKLKSKRLSVNVTNLWFIGVSPGSHGQGIGRKFLQELALSEKNRSRQLILECSPENLNWYKKSGFEIYDYLEDFPSQYFMKSML